MSSKPESRFCCKYCKDETTRNFRFGRISCCVSCEYKKRKYKFFEKTGERKKFCGDCTSIKSLCKTCESIHKDLISDEKDLSSVSTGLLRSSKTYLCQFCKDNRELNFIKLRYTTCRNCYNEMRREKYGSKKSKELHSQGTGGSNGSAVGSSEAKLMEKLDIPLEIKSLWNNFYALYEELQTEIQIKDEEIAELRTQIEDLKQHFKK